MSKTRTVKGVGWDVSALGNGMQHASANVLDVLANRIHLVEKVVLILSYLGWCQIG